MHISAITAVFLLVLTWLGGRPASADQRDSWTANDSSAVAEAAIVVASSASKTTQASMFVELADALIRAGNTPKAKQAAAKAAFSLSQPNDSSTDLRSSYASARIVEKLALLGEVSAAKALATTDAMPSVKAMLLGKFGAGRARAGSIDDARWAANAINSTSDAADAATFAAASANAIAEIGLALADAGALDEALQTAIPLSNGLPKVRALSQAARLICKKDGLGTGLSQRTQEVLQRLASTARFAAEATNRPFEKIDVAGVAGEAFANCRGADSTRAFITETIGPDLRDRALATVVDRLVQRSEFTLARSLLPTADPADAANLFDTANRLIKLGDKAKAREVAIQAADAALKASGEVTRKPGGYYEFIAQLGPIIGTLDQSRRI